MLTFRRLPAQNNQTYGILQENADESERQVVSQVRSRRLPITTEQVAKRVAAESTVSPADVRAVLTALGGVMGDYMAQGRSVKLDGIGSFYFTAATNK